MSGLPVRGRAAMAGAATALLVALAPTQTQDPATPASDPTLAAACARLVEQLDRSFNAGAADAYCAAFRPDHPLVQSRHERAVRRLLAGGDVRRETTMGTPRRVGPQIVVPLRYELHGGARPPMRTHGLLVARPLDPKEKALEPVLAVDVPAAACTDDDVFTCPACNYRIGGVPGWLCVPIPQERSAVVEAAAFLLLGTDIGCEISVELGDDAVPAAATLARLGDEVRRRVPAAQTSAPEPWLPPSITLRPAGLDGARTRIDLGDGQRLLLFALALGNLRHLLLVRGGERALDRRQDDVAALLQSYHLLETDRDLAHQAALSLRAHTGGDCTAHGSYHNERHGVEASGPHGWQPVRRCAGALFQVVWTCPRGSGRMWLTGYGVPDGLEHWDAALADRWLRDLLDRGGLTMVAGSDSGWADADGGARARQLQLSESTAAGAARHRYLRLLLRQDVLVVTDAYTVEVDELPAVQQAVASVRSSR